MLSLITTTNSNKVAAGIRRVRPQASAMQEGRDFIQQVSSFNKNRY